MMKAAASQCGTQVARPGGFFSPLRLGGRCFLLALPAESKKLGARTAGRPRIDTRPPVMKG